MWHINTSLKNIGDGIKLGKSKFIVRMFNRKFTITSLPVYPTNIFHNIPPS